MSSRQEEKARRRAERLAKERAERAREQRVRRLRLIGGGGVAAAIAVGIVLVVIAGGGDQAGSSAGGEGPPPPPVRERDLQAAASKAGCTLRQPRLEGAGHVTGTVTYRSNPPTSGEHSPEPAQDAIYEPGDPPAVEQSVHSLEHGRVIFQYRPGSTASRIQQLQNMANEEVKGTAGYKTLVFENQTDMPYAVAATSWTQLIGCKTFDDAAFDALRAFREQYVDKGPEFVP